MATLQNMTSTAPPPDKGATIIAVCSALTGLATLFVAASFYVKRRIQSRIGLDDWLILISVIFTNIMLGLDGAAVHVGLGRSVASLSEKQKSHATFYTLAAFAPGLLSIGTSKLSVVAFLTKITVPSRKHKIFLWSMAGFCLFNLVGCIVIIFGQCSPARSQWDESISGACWTPWIWVYHSIGACSTSAALDLYLAIYPAIILYQLQMSRKKKLAISIALGWGSIASAVAAYKSTRLSALATGDLYETSDITTWTNFEGNAIIIAACIPKLQPVFDQIWRRRFFNRSSDRGHRHIPLPAVDSNGSGSTPKSYTGMGISDSATLETWRSDQESILGLEQRDSEGRLSIRRTQDVVVEYERVSMEEERCGSKKSCLEGGYVHQGGVAR